MDYREHDIEYIVNKYKEYLVKELNLFQGDAGYVDDSLHDMAKEILRYVNQKVSGLIKEL